MSNPTRVFNSIRIFTSYSHKDESYKDELIKHLSGLRRSGRIESWDDRQIAIGGEWDNSIKRELENCNLFIALVSNDYLNSSYIQDFEFQTALKKADQGLLKIVPIILRPCDWSGIGLEKLQCLPLNGKPISSFEDRDEAFLFVVDGIKNVIDSMLKKEDEDVFLEKKEYANIGGFLTQFPNKIFSYKELESIDLSNNNLTVIPELVTSFPKLKVLNLKGNDITEIPKSLSQLHNLEVLNISNNEIIKIPEFISQMNSLKELYLDSNQISEVLPSQLNLEELESITLTNNPIQNLPKELFESSGNTISQLKSYFKDLAENPFDCFYEAKLIIVGAGGAGKTTLARKIIDPDSPLPHNNETTKGIDVLPYTFPIQENNSTKFYANIWDFGGQAIYHATHQFFLTERSLYVLLVDNRKEDTDFDYWLSVIDLFSNGSPVIIAINEKGSRKKDIDLKKLQSYYPFILNAYNSNFANNNGLEILRTAIKSRILELDHIGTPIPSKWIAIREYLVKENRNYITYSQFLSICENFGIEDEESVITISKFLHDLGVTLHFIEDEVLSNFVILNPDWGTDAVYKVLDDKIILANRGKFKEEDLGRVWKGREYNLTARKALIRLMKKFGLCYEIGVSNNYIAPQLLAEERPEYSWESLLDESLELQFKYEYNFMPKGILHRLIAQMNRYIFNENNIDYVWKNGVVFFIKNAIAEVTQNTFSGQKNITIKLKGERRKELLSIIREELKDIHTSFSEELEFFEEMIPCCCISECRKSFKPYFFKEKIIQKARKQGVKNLQCNNSFEQVQIEDLVNGVKPESFINNTELLSVFVSYSRKDTDLREKLETHLSNLKKNKLIEAWVDHQITPGQEWENEILTNLNSADIVLLLISPDFNFSSYCDKELKIALDRHNSNEAIVVPVILRPCDWSFTEVAKLNALPTAGKAVTKWDNIDEALLDVSLGLRRVVENHRAESFVKI